MFTRRQSEKRSPGITLKETALAFHYCGLGFDSRGLDDVCRLSWSVLDSAPRIFFEFSSLSLPHYYYYYYYFVNNKMLEYD